jgi:glycosyltransferase involved in cell wall biosynthesis
MAAKIPLAVVILTKNEAERLPACIQSVTPWAAEVLVVDDESTDETVRVAESLGARVVRRKMDVEGRHRNWAYDQAGQEWILSLDADERVTLELAEEIMALFANGPVHEAYAIPRRNYIGERWIRYGGWYPSAQLKLFKRAAFRWEETTVHPRAIGPHAESLRYDLLHYSYRDREDFKRKLDRQTSLEAEKWVRDGRRMSLGKALWRTFDRSLRSYVLKQGFRDGRLGWFAARMAGRYQWLSYAKYVRLKRGEGCRPAASGDATADPAAPAPRSLDSGLR